MREVLFLVVVYYVNDVNRRDIGPVDVGLTVLAVGFCRPEDDPEAALDGDRYQPLHVAFQGVRIAIMEVSHSFCLFELAQPSVNHLMLVWVLPFGCPCVFQEFDFS